MANGFLKHSLRNGCEAAPCRENSKQSYIRQSIRRAEAAQVAKPMAKDLEYAFFEVRIPSK
jgi:hypothetical protein